MSIFKDLISIIVFSWLIISLYKADNIYLAFIVILIITTIYLVRLVLLNKSVKHFLINRNQMFEMLFNSSTDIIVYRDLDSKIVACNTMLEKVLGIEKKDILNKTLKKIFDKTLSDTHRIEKILQIINKKTIESFKTGNSVQFFEKFIFADRRICYYNVLISPAYNEMKELVGSIIVARDVTNEELTRQKAQDNEEKLKCILENMPICAFLKDNNNEFMIGSSPFEKFINCKNSEMQKLNLLEIFGKDYLEEVKREDAEVYRTRETLVTIRKVVFPTKTFWGRIHKTPVFDENGNIKYLVIMYENIDKEREVELQKEYFIETLIHDLKIPTLAQLRGLELIRNETTGKINIEQKELVTQIEGSCRYILDMISMVLKTYRLENGQKKIILEKFDILELFQECILDIKYLSDEKNIKITVQERNAEPVFIEADRQDIKTLIINLLSNAITYSDHNEDIFVQINQISSIKLYVSIESKGITLSERECTTLFDKATAKKPQYSTIGHGIALYLCKKIVESHYGDIFASSDGERSNIFTFVIPIEHKKILETAESLLVR